MKTPPSLPPSHLHQSERLPRELLCDIIDLIPNSDHKTLASLGGAAKWIERYLWISRKEKTSNLVSAGEQLKKSDSSVSDEKKAAQSSAIITATKAKNDKDPNDVALREPEQAEVIMSMSAPPVRQAQVQALPQYTPADKLQDVIDIAETFKDAKRKGKLIIAVLYALRPKQAPVAGREEDVKMANCLQRVAKMAPHMESEEHKAIATIIITGLFPSYWHLLDRTSAIESIKGLLEAATTFQEEKHQHAALPVANLIGLIPEEEKNIFFKGFIQRVSDFKNEELKTKSLVHLKTAMKFAQLSPENAGKVLIGLVEVAESLQDPHQKALAIFFLRDSFQGVAGDAQIDGLNRLIKMAESIEAGHPDKPHTPQFLFEASSSIREENDRNAIQGEIAKLGMSIMLNAQSTTNAIA